MDTLLDKHLLFLNDGNLLLSRLIPQRLVPRFASVALAAELDTARDLLADQSYDVLVLDCKLLGGENATFLSSLRQLQPQSILMLTASVEDYPLALNALETGLADDFLAKDNKGEFLQLLPILILQAYQRKKLLHVNSPRQQMALNMGNNESILSENVLNFSGETKGQGDRIFRVLCDSAPIGIFLTDPSGHCLYANPHWEQISGLSRDQTLGDGWVYAIRPDERGAVFAEWGAAIAEQRECIATFHVIRPDGGSRLVVARATPLFDDDQNRIAYVGTVDDITEQKALEASLRQTSLTLDVILNNMPVLVGCYNEDLTLRHANRAYLDWWNTTLEEARGCHIEDVIGRKLYVLNLPHIQGALRGEIQQFDRTIKDPQGRIRQAAVTYVPEMLDGVVYGFFSCFVDITERCEMEIALRQSESQLRAVLDNVPALIGCWDKTLHNRMANHAYLEWFGQTPEAILGRHIRDVIGEELFQKNIPHIEAVLRGEPQSFERIVYSPKGREFHSLVSYVPDYCGDEVVGFFALVRDITPLKQAERALFEEKELARITLNAIGEAVLTTDEQGRIRSLNPVAEGLTGRLTAEVFGQDIEQVLELRDGVSDALLPNPVRRALSARRTVGASGDTVLVRANHTRLAIEDTTAPIFDQQGRLVGTVTVFRDVSRQRMIAAEMNHLAQHDGLTDLPNRLLLQDRVAQEIRTAERKGGKLGLLFIDLDNLKVINDSYGHAAGDALLREVARRMRSALRAVDTVSRLGGDEFVVLLPEICGPEDAASVAEKLLHSIHVPIHYAERSLITSASIGLALFPDDGLEMHTLMRHADASMYQAKQAGRNRFHSYSMQPNDWPGHQAVDDPRRSAE